MKVCFNVSVLCCITCVARLLALKYPKTKSFAISKNTKLKKFYSLNQCPLNRGLTVYKLYSLYKTLIHIL